MEQTLLEARLEKYLPTIGMELKKRVYGEDKDFQAEFEDLINPLPVLNEGLKGDERLQVALDRYLLGSEEQLYKGRQALLERESNIFNGFGMKYILAVYLMEKISAERLDCIIKNREFDKTDCEVLELFYDADEAWRSSTINQRSQTQLANRFYSTTLNRKLFLEILKDSRISVLNFAREGNYEGCLKIRGLLDGIEQDFNGKILNEESVNDLMKYIGELKELMGK